MRDAEIGIFGGSGFYAFVSGLEEHRIHTPYGQPSGPVAVGELAGRRIAFLPRHGPNHELPAHAIDYRANLWAFRELGVTRVIGPGASGSLQPHIHPGEVVVCDQLVDRTKGRDDTFYDGPHAVHISWANPFCPQLRPLAAEAASEAGMRVHEGGTVVVISGPRFSTRAESEWYTQAGWEAINMTAYPEAYLARELEMCYVNLCLVTDYDAGLRDDPGVPPVTMEEVFRVFRENLDKLRDALAVLIERIPAEQDCPCGDALEGTPLGP